MSDIHYTIVEHDGGWAYKVGGVFSETFPTHDHALAAAKDASARQELAGETSGIRYQDGSGVWHDEVARGDDRPHADVVDVEAARS
jgi:hypothetical protein